VIELRLLARPALCAVLLRGAIAQAGTSEQLATATFSADGTSVIVMVPLDQRDELRRPDVFVNAHGEAAFTTDVFPQSGLYDIATLEPIWLVDWYSLPGDMTLSRDASLVVRHERRGMTRGWALKFYRDGQLVRTYTCDELLQNFRSHAFLHFQSWDWHFRWYEGFEFAEGDVLHVTTARRALRFVGWTIDLGYHEHYRFDMRTGEMLSCRYAGLNRLAIVLALPIVALSVTVIALKQLWRIARRRLGRVRLLRGLCPSCGYDCRACSSRCAECGWAL
jgi:hypothetical protein